MLRQQQEKAAEGGGRLPQATKKVGIADDNSREAAKNCCGSNKAPPQAEKAHGVCRPGRDELSIGKLQSFLPYFLYFTKSRKKKSPQGGGEAAERQKNVAAATEKCRRRRQKDLIGFVRSRCLGVLIRGL